MRARHEEPMLNEREIESCYLGQFIPVHYHHNMLMDQKIGRAHV